MLDPYCFWSVLLVNVSFHQSFNALFTLTIAPDKRGYPHIFFLFLKKKNVVGTH